MLKEFLIGMVVSAGFPVTGEITSKFGKRMRNGVVSKHAGIDIAAEFGYPVSVVADGVVEFVGFQKGYGHIVIVRHQPTLITKYAHLAASFVEEGDEIEMGLHIGMVGETGRATGPHLHYEILRNDIPINPLKYYFTKNSSLRKRK